MSEVNGNLTLDDRELIAKTETAAVERINIDGEQYALKHDLTSPEQSVSIVDFDGVEFTPSDVRTTRQEVTIDKNGDITVPDTRETEVVRRAEVFAEFYEQSCPSPLYRDHGAAGMTFQLTERADELSKRALGGVICTAIGSAIPVVGQIATVSVGTLCAVVAGEVLNQASPEGGYTAGYVDRDSGGFIPTPYVAAGLAGRYDADPDTWTELPIQKSPGVHLSPAINET